MQFIRSICKTTPLRHFVHANVVADQQGVVHVKLLTFPACSSACHPSIISCSNFPAVKKLEVVEQSEKSSTCTLNIYLVHMQWNYTFQI